MTQAPASQQADLLSILSVFAEPLVAPEAFVAMVGKERLMASDLLSYLVEEKLAEIEQQHAAELRITLQDATEDVIVARFPDTPIGLVQRLRGMSDPARLKALRAAVLAAPDQAAVEQMLAGLAADAVAPDGA